MDLKIFCITAIFICTQAVAASDGLIEDYQKQKLQKLFVEHPSKHVGEVGSYHERDTYEDYLQPGLVWDICKHCNKKWSECEDGPRCFGYESSNDEKVKEKLTTYELAIAPYEAERERQWKYRRLVKSHLLAALEASVNLNNGLLKISDVHWSETYDDITEQMTIQLSDLDLVCDYIKQHISSIDTVVFDGKFRLTHLEISFKSLLYVTRESSIPITFMNCELGKWDAENLKSATMWHGETKEVTVTKHDNEQLATISEHPTYDVTIGETRLDQKLKVADVSNIKDVQLLLSIVRDPNTETDVLLKAALNNNANINVLRLILKHPNANRQDVLLAVSNNTAADIDITREVVRRLCK